MKIFRAALHSEPAPPCGPPPIVFVTRCGGRGSIRRRAASKTHTLPPLLFPSSFPSPSLSFLALNGKVRAYSLTSPPPSPSPPELDSTRSSRNSGFHSTLVSILTFRPSRSRSPDRITCRAYSNSNRVLDGMVLNGPGGGSNVLVVAKTVFRSRVTRNEATPFLSLFFSFYLKLIINLFSPRWYCIIHCKPACWRAQQLRRLQAV